MKTNKFGFCIENTYLNLPPVLYTIQTAVPVKDPEILLLNTELAAEMGLNAQAIKSSEGAQILSGNRILPDVASFAQAYSGHQFGYFNHLGDGRALMIGEHVKPDGDRVDIQLKGSGPTPYSRRGDGRAGLSPMLREYLISEAMAGLGVPTTRSLAVVSTGEDVYREVVQEGAILTRVASSHIRIGTFQYAASRGDETLKALFDYTLERQFPACLDAADSVECMLYAVAERQAKCIAKWQSLGFVHGVMNTDNAALSGETIDYGPCAFLDTYDPEAVFSAIDTSGRYRFKHQPLIGKWNLARFAETLLPLFKTDGERIANASLEHFDAVYEAEWLLNMQKKLGLFTTQTNDKSLVHALLDCMTMQQLDYHDTFLKLTRGVYESKSDWPYETFQAWHQKWTLRRAQEPHNQREQKMLMQSHNPAIIPRNHNVERVLNDWVLHGNAKPFKALLELLKNPYLYTEAQIEGGAPQQSWPKRYTTTCGT